MTHRSSVACLKFASIVLIGFGALFIAALFTPAMAAVELLLDLVIPPFGDARPVAAAETRLLLAISGGVMAGWGVMMWMIVTSVYDEDPALGGRMIVASICVWFVLDGLGSVLAGAWINAFVNVTFLALFTAPVLMRSDASAQKPA